MADGFPSTGGSKLGPQANDSWHDASASDQHKPRDWKRLVLVTGLGILSWVATYVGLLELIEANMGDLPLVHKIIIGFSVAMLMVMVVWLLDQIFSDIGWTTRLIYVGGYVFLTLISVGFGFGFYWKVLESRGESSRSAEAAVGQVQTSLFAAVTRLEQLQSTLDQLTALSAEKASLERANGTSCPNSRPGDGPRRQMRDDDAGRFKFAGEFVKGRVATIKGELGGLNDDLAKVVSADKATFDAATGTRNEFLRGLSRRLDMTVTGFNAFRSDPQLRQIRADLGERADRTTFADTKGGTFACPDAQLTTALRGVVRAIDELPLIEKPRIAAVEGSEAVVEAFRRLATTFYGALAFKLPPSPEELRDLQKRAVQSVDGAIASAARLSASEAAGLSKRDYIPLAIAVFVDLCLLLVAIRRPGSALDRLVPRMRDAEQGPVIQILSRFNEIHRDREIRESFEVFRHVVFDFHGDYYAAIPLNTPYRPNPANGAQRQRYGVSDAEELMQEAHLLSNLFASFEKERIFTRVMSPFLSTGTVQRRLRRQGSKFAAAEAFRVYRFRDGAWSEFILGAVMGAARRVEGEKRRRAERDKEAARFGRQTLQDPSRDGPASGGAAATARRAQANEAGRRPRSDTADGADPSGTGWRTQPGWSQTARTPFMPQVVQGGASSDGPTGHPPANADVACTGFAPEARHGGGPPAVSRAENVVLHPAAARPMPAGMADETAVAGPAPVASAATTGAAAPHYEQALAMGRNLSTGPDATPAPELQIGRLAEPTVTVAATRETVTYTMPASEARLPPSLTSRDPSQSPLDARPASGQGGLQPGPVGWLPPPLKPSLAGSAENMSPSAVAAIPDASFQPGSAPNSSGSSVR
ncbi:MAG: hypothetical protein SFW09_18675 [Hyphomicrobiaceae bacterium]|nr:hypothetical protein [Hyphomicrobiaceae bacterium]